MKGRIMVEKKRRPAPERTRSSETASGDVQKYNGHEIVIPRDDPGHRVMVDGNSIQYGRAGDQFYLDIFAYDRDVTLIGVVRRYLDYRDAAAARASKASGR
jgi:hypothetical protein